MNIGSFLTQHAHDRSLPAPRPAAQNLDLGSPLPRGWEQCLDLKSGVIYFKDSITGARTYSDPRVIDSGGFKSYFSDEHRVVDKSIDRRWGSFIQPDDTVANHALLKFSGPGGLRGQDHISNDKSVDLDLRLALKSSDGSSSCSSLSSLSAPKTDHQDSRSQKVSSPLASFISLSCTSKCSSSSSSPSVMSFQPDEETELLEVESSQRLFGIDLKSKDAEPIEAMTTAGCLRCLMYVLLSNRDPRCPKCGNTVLLNFPAPSAPKQKYEDLQMMQQLR